MNTKLLLGIVLPLFAACGSGVYFDEAESDHVSELHGMRIVIQKGAEVPEEFEAWMTAAATELDGVQEGLTFALLPCAHTIDAANPKVMGRYYSDGNIGVRACPEHVRQAVPHELTHRWLHVMDGDMGAGHGPEFWRAMETISARVLYN